MECLQSLKLKKGEDFCGGALHHMFEVGKLNNLTSLNLSECKNVDDAVVKAMVKWWVFTEDLLLFDDMNTRIYCSWVSPS